jgi:protein TonB
VTGLTMTGLGPKPKTYAPTVEFTTPPPPPPTPSPSEAAEATVVVPTAPVPPIELPPMPGPTRAPFDPQVIPDVVPRADPGPATTPAPRPAPSFTPTAARPSNSSASWITADDYPRRSRLEGSEGVARYRLAIGADGRVSNCEITASTGDRRLDEATCRFITRRARFQPATDETGAEVTGTFGGSVLWEIP